MHERGPWPGSVRGLDRRSRPFRSQLPFASRPASPLQRFIPQGREAAIEIASEQWALRRTMWVIQVAPSPGEATLLQAEVEDHSYVLAFTTDEKAHAAIHAFDVDGAWTAQVPSRRSVDLVAAVCQVGAVGIIVDLDPATQRCAWSRRLTTEA
jgi:hypothetical protein